MIFLKDALEIITGYLLKDKNKKDGFKIIIVADLCFR